MQEPSMVKYEQGLINSHRPCVADAEWEPRCCWHPSPYTGLTHSSIRRGLERGKLDCVSHSHPRWISLTSVSFCYCLFMSFCLSLAQYLPLHLFPLPSVFRVSLRHVRRPCQQNRWRTVFISMLKDARPLWQLWELSTGIRQSPPCREAAACLLGWRPFWDWESFWLWKWRHICYTAVVLIHVLSHLSCSPAICFHLLQDS